MIELKVCGIADVATASGLNQLPVDYLGLIFVSKSLRAVTIEKAKEIASNADKKWIGVFMDEAIDTIEEAVSALSLFGVQLHGDESVDSIHELRGRLDNDVEIWKAVHISEESDMAEVSKYDSSVDKILLDTKLNGEKAGGTGQKFDWNILQQLESDVPCILSGGIGPDDAPMINSIAKATQQIQMVDINSRFETSPGVKDLDAVKRFTEELER